jgi:hypothetical protein
MPQAVFFPPSPKIDLSLSLSQNSPNSHEGTK